MPQYHPYSPFQRQHPFDVTHTRATRISYTQTRLGAEKDDYVDKRLNVGLGGLVQLMTIGEGKARCKIPN